MSSQVQESVKQQSPKAKVVKKSTSPKVAKPAPTHPKFIDMIVDGLKKLNERSGSSRYALLKYITATYNLDSKVANQHLKLALKNGVKNGALKQLKGIGSNGSFKLGDATKQAEAKKAKVVKKTTSAKVAKKPTEKKVVKKVAKKVASGEEKPKKNVKKIVKPKAPKPVSSEAKPAAAVKPKVAKKTVAKSETKSKVPKVKSSNAKVTKKVVNKKPAVKKVVAKN